MIRFGKMVGKQLVQPSNLTLFPILLRQAHFSQVETTISQVALPFGLNSLLAIRDELKLHADLALRQCAEERAWDLLWRVYGDGLRSVNCKAGECPQAEHPAEDEPEEAEGEDAGSSEEEDPDDDESAGEQEG